MSRKCYRRLYVTSGYSNSTVQLQCRAQETAYKHAKSYIEDTIVRQANLEPLFSGRYLGLHECMLLRNMYVYERPYEALLSGQLSTERKSENTSYTSRCYSVLACPNDDRAVGIIHNTAALLLSTDDGTVPILAGWHRSTLEVGGRPCPARTAQYPLSPPAESPAAKERRTTFMDLNSSTPSSMLDTDIRRP
eukprot:1175871-Prorocentrum_minimum.AAC.1